MLQKVNRLTTAEFEQYYKQAKRSHFDHLTISYLPLPTFKVAVVVGKKVSKRAVKRNMVRRRIFALLAKIHFEQSLTGVFIVHVKPSYLTLPRTAANEFCRESIAALQQKA